MGHVSLGLRVGPRSLPLPPHDQVKPPREVVDQVIRNGRGRRDSQALLGHPHRDPLDHAEVDLQQVTHLNRGSLAVATDSISAVTCSASVIGSA